MDSTDEPVDQVAQSLTLETNWALGRPAIQSSVGWNGVPGRAVDGNTDGNFWDGSVTHTTYEDQPYWQVDLGQSRHIDAVELWNRTDCCSDRLNNFFVFYKDTPFIARKASDLINEDGVTFDARLVAQGNPVTFTSQRSGRYVRVQLGGEGYLSLAEVRVLAKSTVLGPPKIATHTSWVPTGIVTEDQALAAVDVQGVVHAFYRGEDGVLHDAAQVDGTLDALVPGSPALATSGVAAAFDPASGKVFVAVPIVPYGVRIVEGTASGGTISNWTWTVWQGLNYWSSTTGAPALATGCGRVFLAVHMSNGVIGTSRPIDGGAWTDGSVIAQSQMPPAIAVNGRGDVAEAVVGDDGKVVVNTFACQSGSWGGNVTLAPQMPSQLSADKRVGLAAIGNRFAAAIVNQDESPLVMVQSGGSVDAPTWPASYESPNASTHVIGVVKEAPTLFTYRGLLIMGARNPDNSLRYALRNPNVAAYRTDQAAQMWTTGPHVVGNYGVGAVRPVFVETGRDDRWTAGNGWASNVPTELVVLTKGIGDRQIYGADFARFAMLDVLVGVYGIGIHHWAPVEQLQNASDQLLAFMMSPAPVWAAQAHPAPCGGSRAEQLFITTDYGENTQEWCSGNAPDMTLNGTQADPSWLWQEWGHTASWGAQLTARNDFQGLFQATEPRRCASVADCRGPSGTSESYGYCGPVVEGSAAEALLGAGAMICWTSQARDRMQGYVEDYDLNGNGLPDHSQHAFLDVVTFYRWYGAQLRAWVAEDQLQGSNLLAAKYAWIRDNFYGGVEYNGTGTAATDGATSDESLGAYAAPLR